MKHVQPLPSHTTAAPTPTPTAKCKEGEKMCNKVGSVTCTNGDWVTYPCPKGQYCNSGNKFQCTKPEPHCDAEDDKPCKHGEFKCTSHSTARCNWGQWVHHPCAHGTVCVEKDWECIRKDQIPNGLVPYKSPCDQPKPSPSPTTSTTTVTPTSTTPPPSKPTTSAPPAKPTTPAVTGCTHGSFKCSSSGVDQCTWGSWTTHTCPKGTVCFSLYVSPQELT